MPNFGGVKILNVYEDLIIFLTTKRGIVLFYSIRMNKIIQHEILNKIVYINSKSIIFENKIFISDSEGKVHEIKLPNKYT